MPQDKFPVNKVNSIPRKNSKNVPITNAFLIADIHLGWNMGSEEWKDNSEEYFTQFFIPLIEREKDEGSIVLCLGDVFENRKTTNIAVNDLAISVFEKLASILPVYIINGNHDMYHKTHNDITSLRSFDNIPNLFMFKEPTVWTVGESGKWSKNLLMVPFQDDTQKETDLINQNPTDYIFMHTEIKNLAYDNGMQITLGVDTSSVKGKLFAGHIHKRQEKGDLIYVGSPYQLKRNKNKNKKGVYRVFFENGTTHFYENNISPEFVEIALDDLETMEYEAIYKTIHHNYVELYIKSERRTEVSDIFERYTEYKPRRLDIKEISQQIDWETKDAETKYTEKTVPQIVDELIDNMEADQSKKDALKHLNNQILQSIEIAE